MFANSNSRVMENGMDIVDVIERLANRESSPFRTIIGRAGNDLPGMRNSLPIDEYRETIRKSCW